MAITAPIAGAYTTTWAGAALNYTRQGFNLNYTIKAEKLEETDIYGLSLIEMVYRGAQLIIDCICKVYGAGPTGVLAAFVTTFGQVWNPTNPIGMLATTKAGSLVMTAVASTSAAASPATLTCLKSIVSPDNNFQIVFNSVIREVPLKFEILTHEPTTSGTLFSTT